MLYAEADHRIANSLAALSSLLRLKSRRVGTADEARFVLLDVSGRIETIGRLHRLLAGVDTAPLSLGAYLRQVCDAMQAALEGADAISVDYACPDEISVSPKAGLPLGLLVAELVTNAVKHAHPKGGPLALRLSCRRLGSGELEVEFQDDGVGFPANFNPEESGGLGMHLIRSLVDQLGAKFRWDSGLAGLSCTLTLPAEAAA